jgi:hypothetical protein
MASTAAATAATAATASNTNTNTTIVVAHDIEKTGSRLQKDRVISVAFCVGTAADGIVRERIKFNLDVNWPTVCGRMLNDFEPRCWEEFWSKQPRSVINACLDNPKPLFQADGWNSIRKWINDLESKYPNNAEIIFVTDNPSFDTAAIDLNLEIWAGRTPMRYSTKGEYRSVRGVNDLFRMLSPDDQAKVKKHIELNHPNIAHDHDALHDAEYLYWKYYYTMQFQGRNATAKASQ